MCLQCWGVPREEGGCKPEGPRLDRNFSNCVFTAIFSNLDYCTCTHCSVGELVEAGFGLHLVELGEVVHHGEEDDRHDVEGAAAHLRK